MQQAPEDPYHIQASACCKHYVANSMDGTTEADGEHHDRNHVDSEVPMQDLIDSYMLPFQACVEKGKVTSLMCSYNAVNGVPSCANSWLLDTIARKEWGFDGPPHSLLLPPLHLHLCCLAAASCLHAPCCSH